MTEADPELEIAALLRRADAADPTAPDQLFSLLYDELHRLAERQLRQGGASLTLGTTTLVHEISVASKRGFRRECGG